MFIVDSYLWLTVGVVARDPALFPCLKAALTEERLQEVFGHLMQRKEGQTAQIKR